ncbi:MAG: hypothetical protein ABI845_04500 [Polaromonas sp.]
MNTLISRLLGRTPSAKEARRDTGPATDGSVTIEDGSDNAMRRQLVLVLLRDVIRRHGIPPHWIELQMLVVSSASRGAGLYVRLVVRHWDARLLNHAQAFQNELMADIVRFEPKAADWLHGISWQLEMSDSCPYTTLPDKAFWQEPAQRLAPPTAPPVRVNEVASAAQPARSTPESEAMEDLNQLFFIRDREINGAAAEAGPRDFEKTRPLPL